MLSGALCLALDTCCCGMLLSLHWISNCLRINRKCGREQGVPINRNIEERESDLKNLPEGLVRKTLQTVTRQCCLLGYVFIVSFAICVRYSCRPFLLFTWSSIEIITLNLWHHNYFHGNWLLSNREALWGQQCRSDTISNFHLSSEFQAAREWTQWQEGQHKKTLH